MTDDPLWTRRELLVGAGGLVAMGWLASCKHTAVIAPESDGEDSDDTGGDEGGNDGGGGGGGGSGGEGG